MLFLRNAEPQDKNQLIDLWKKCFDDTEQGIKLFFDDKYSKTDCYVVVTDEKIVSAVYLLPCEVNNVKSHYIYAAATHPDYQKQGIMSDLLKYAEFRAKNKMQKFSFLMPSNEKLYNYYEKNGYKKVCFANKKTIYKKDYVNFYKGNLKYKIFDLNNTPSKEDLEKIYKIRNQDKNINFINWNAEDVGYAVKFNATYGGTTVLTDNGYIVLSAVKDNKAFAAELLCSNENLNEFISLVLKLFNLEELTFSQMPKKGEDNIFYGMAKQIAELELENNYYIGLSLE